MKEFFSTIAKMMQDTIAVKLQRILTLHQEWVNDPETGRQANFSLFKAHGLNLSNANLRGALFVSSDLSGADFSNSVLSGADFRNANLSNVIIDNTKLSRCELEGANLTGVDLRRADLTDIRVDLKRVCKDFSKAEIGVLRQKLIEGNIDGMRYSGEYRCLIGTLAQARGVPDFQLNRIAFANSTAEIWFGPIRPGYKPDNSQIVSITVEWLDEILAER